jgi:GT2 family glycosyltransferase
MTDPKVAIVLVNWNGLNDTIDCIRSLNSIDYPNYEIVVIDNGSSLNEAEK